MAITGKFIADFSSFLKAISDSETALLDMSKGASGVQTKLNNLSDSFSGRRIIQEATLMATALEQAGGSSKLTGQELERVGAKAAEAAEKMRALGYDVPPGIQKLADETAHLREVNESTGLSFTKLVESYVSAQAIIAGVKAAYAAITGEISRSITAASEAEKAHTQLVAALRAQGTAVPSVIEAFTGYATALQKTTIYQDDAIESATALLVLVGNVMPRDMEKALKATTDLASGLGKDLNEAAQLVAKAAEGNTTALRRSGIVIDETKAKAQGFGYVLDEIEKKFGGQAEALAGTYQGRLAQLGNTWNNVEESIGRVITQNATVLRAFQLINDAIDIQTGELKDNATATNLVSSAVILAARSFSTLIQAIDIGQTIGSGFTITIRNMGAALGNIGILALEASKGVAAATLNFKAVAAAQIGIDALKSAVKELGDRNEATTARSAAFGQKLEDIASAAGGLAVELEKTRGQTVKLADGSDKATNAWTRQTKAVEQTKETIFEFSTTYGLLDGAFNRAADGLTIAGDHLTTVIPLFATLTKWLDPELTGALANAREELSLLHIDKLFDDAARASEGAHALTENLRGLGAQLPKTTIALNLGQQISANLAASLKSIPQTIVNAFTGGGGLSGGLQAIGSSVGSSVGDGIGKSIAFLGAAGGPIGAAIGSLAGPLIGLVGKLFGNPEKEINPVREAYVQAAGGLALLNEKAFAATGSLALVRQLLDAKNAEQYKKAIDALGDAFAFHDQALQTLQATIEKYGFTLEELPAKLRQGGLDKAFLELYQDQQVLVAGGFEFDAVLVKQRDSFLRLLETAQVTGASIPEQLRPAVERMKELGLFTDDTGKDLVDLSKLTWAQTVDKQILTLVESIQKLVDAITGIPKAVTIGVNYDVQPFPGIPDTGNSGEPIRAAAGFNGDISGPTLFLAGEGGNREHVSITPVGGGGRDTGLLQSLNDKLDSLPRAIRDAILLAG